jgi:hypothetical protein
MATHLTHPSAAAADAAVPPVLRRRLLWLIGCWVGEVKGEVRAALYGALVGVLGDESPSNDLAVRLTALETLKVVHDVIVTRDGGEKGL